MAHVGIVEALSQSLHLVKLKLSISGAFKKAYAAVSRRTNKLKRTNSRTELLGNNFLQVEASHPGGRLRRLRENHLTRPSELKLKIMLVPKAMEANSSAGEWPA